MIGRNYWMVVALILAASAGCAGNKQKAKAHQEWNGARAGVLGSLANSQYSTGNLDKARQTIGQALALDPKNAGLHILSARIDIEQNHLESAMASLNQAAVLAPTNGEVDYLSGVINQRWQRPQLALDCYQRACDKAPEDLAYVLARAEMLVAMDRSAEALALLDEKATSFEHSGALRDAAGQILVQQGKYGPAVERLRQASLLSPDDLTIREHLGLALFWAGDYREAADMLARLLKEERYASRAELWVALGQCQLRSGQARQARESIATAAQLEPAGGAVWLSLGQVAMELNDLKRAEISIRRALSLDATSAEAQLMMGYVCLKQNRLTEALSAFQKASLLDPRDSVSLCMIGQVMQRLGHASRAAEYYAKALKLSPDDQMASQLLAQVQLAP